MMSRLCSGAVAGAIWPVIAAHPLHALLKDDAILDRADAVDRSPDWQPLFLSPEQDRTLVELAESMVPGSTKARVHRFIDLLLSVGTKEEQDKFAASLAAFQSASQGKFGRAVPELTAVEKDQLLTLVSTDPARQPHFENLKEWISTAYYSSEEGMRELGWAGEHAFRVLSSCDHAPAE